jgi:hypothetical protein
MGGSFVNNKMHSTFERRTARPLTTPEQQQQRSLSVATLKHKMLYREEEKAAHSRSQQESRKAEVKDWNAYDDSRKRDQQANKKEKEIPSEASERERERESGGGTKRRLGLTFQETRITPFFLPPTTPTISTTLALFPLHLPHTHTRDLSRKQKQTTHTPPHPPPPTPPPPPNSDKQDNNKLNSSSFFLPRISSAMKNLSLRKTNPLTTKK